MGHAVAGRPPVPGLVAGTTPRDFGMHRAVVPGWHRLKTEYISFKPPAVAAVKMLNRPPFFETFAATLRHRDTADGGSTVEYIYHFTARPRWLRWLLHPVMNAVFRWETRKRLRSLRRYLALRQLQPD